MKISSVTLIRIGGLLNSLLTLFHLFLGYEIHATYYGQEFYPLMQMLNIACTLLIFFLAISSIVYAHELINSKLGRLVIVINILLYLLRSIGEIVLFPQLLVFVIVVCLLIAAIYGLAYYVGFKELTRINR